jgi:D-alanyl-lipoteichoic acid acyltransferase DltB (MBOAT superfamily)
MSFLSFPFWAAFLVFAAIYFSLPGRWQNRWLVVGGFSYLLSWGWLAVTLHAASSLVCFFSSRKITNSPPKSQTRRGYLLLCFVAQLGLLLVFKIRAAQGFALPIGLSFYSLMMLGYVLEVYWSRIEAAKRFFEFYLFASFFPLICVGPIERYGRLANQWQETRVVKLENLSCGIYWIALGVFKKLTIADVLFPFVVHTDPATNKLCGAGLLAYCFLSFMQIYADFSGLIDIGRGIAKILGFDLIENFIQPYFAFGVSDLWRRWHSSLTGWLRDFVYLPLMLSTRNVLLAGFVVLFLTGMWHELSSNYALWSLYWSLMLGAYFLFRKVRAKIALPVSAAERAGGWIATLLVTSVSTLCFMSNRENSFQSLLFRLLDFMPQSFASLFEKTALDSRGIVYVFVCIGTMILIESAQRRVSWRSYPALIAVLVFLTAAFATAESRAFIYLRY